MRRAALLAVLLAAAPAAALEWVPIGGITALGGMHSFEGQRGSLSGDVDASFAPALAVSETWSVLPSARALYEGTRRLTDVLGTDTPAQQSAEARLGLRGVYADPESRWRFKPTASYNAQWLKETADENWGQGLFDQRRLAGGGEVELVTREPHSVRLAAEYFTVSYPNYTTLESQAALQFQGRSLARELVGAHALDRDGWQFSLAADGPVGPRAVLDVKADVAWSTFHEQRVIDEGGQFQAEQRQDVLADFALTLRMPHDWNADLRALGGLELGAIANSSNQNGYDASRGRFLPGFYDYVEWRAVPSATFILGPVRRPVSVTVKAGWKRREYAHRPPQSESGAYGDGSLRSTEWSGGVSVSYPMVRSLSLIFDFQRASAASNQRFQAFYRYSYQATTALAGVRWDW